MVPVSVAREEVTVVAHVDGGSVARPRAATSARELVWLAPPLEVWPRAAHALVCGPSFLALLEVFPVGELPPETRAAIVDALSAPLPHGHASLQRLRYDLDDRVFRWAASPSAVGVAGDDALWAAGMAARLVDGGGPCLERVFTQRPAFPAPTASSLPSVPADVDVEAGRRHLAGIVAAALPDALAAAHERREAWWISDGSGLSPPSEAEVNAAKSCELFAQHEHDLVRGRMTSARMHAKLAAIYRPSRRNRRVLAALELSPLSPAD